MGDSESEDSENEGTLGNVCRAVMRPPGHTGKAKKGHLCFDASFETGNLGSVELISPSEYDLFIRPDTCNPRLRIWFNFTVDNTKPDQRVIFNIVNFSKRRLCFLDGMTPIVKSTSRPTWQRMREDNVFYHSSPYHSNNYILSLAFNFDREEDVYQFAFSYPYSYSLCQQHLDQLDQRALPHFKRELLGHSLQKRRLELVTISRAENMVPGGGKVRVVVILARVHPGDSPASYVCQGMIDFLVSSHPIAVCLREKIVFKIIPMLNPDGVFLGNQRCSQVGADLNRTWNKISRWLHPTIHAAYTFITSMDQDKDIELDIILDIHAHTSLRGVFITGNTYSDVYRYERHIVFPKQLSQNVLGFENDFTVYNKDILKSGTSRRLLCDLLKSSVNCYSLIVSFHGYCCSKSSNFKNFTQETYYKVGRNVVKSFYEYYKNSGVIVRPSKKPKSGERKSRGLRRWSRSERPLRSQSAPSPILRPGKCAVLELRLASSPPPAAGSTRSGKADWKRRERGKEAARVGERPGVPRTPVHLPPSLAIVDFNSLARDLLANRSPRS